MSGAGETQVSYGYLNDLRHKPEHSPFRERYKERTGELLNVLEVDSEFIVSRIVDIAKNGKPDSAKLDALKTLGREYLDVLEQQKTGGGVNIAIVQPVMHQAMAEIRGMVNDLIALYVPEAERSNARGYLAERVQELGARVDGEVVVEDGVFRPLLQDKKQRR